MPVPITAVRRQLQFWIRGAAAQKYGATRLYQELVAGGRAYRYQDYLSDYRSYTTAYERGQKLKYVRRDYKPTSALFSETRVGMRKTFKYNTSTVFYDKSGHVYSTRNSFVSSDVQLTMKSNCIL